MKIIVYSRGEGAVGDVSNSTIVFGVRIWIELKVPSVSPSSMIVS